MLLDLGELHQLLCELVGVERIERILVFQLRRQQLQERCKVAGDLGVVDRIGDGAAGGRGGGGEGVVVIVVMAESSDADVETAALPGKAAIALRNCID